jgi:hypothetical protein
MTLMYGSLGTVGYWSRGSGIRSIVIFDLPDSWRARAAASCILLQVVCLLKRHLKMFWLAGRRGH